MRKKAPAASRQRLRRWGVISGVVAGTCGEGGGGDQCFINLFHLPSWNTRHRQSIGSSACPVVRVLLMQVRAAILLRPFYLQAVAA